jgi:hypothetical protein
MMRKPDSAVIERYMQQSLGKRLERAAPDASCAIDMIGR